jgi:hypothetical protein
MKSPLTRSLRKQTPMKIERFHMTLKKQILSTYEKILVSLSFYNCCFIEYFYLQVFHVKKR